MFIDYCGPTVPVVDAHTKAAAFFGGWATLTISDNLKSGVTKTDRYVPVLNASYEQWADHYQTAIIPARPYKPKDKAKAKNGVLMVERWIIARLRKHTFFSLGELNDTIAHLLVELKIGRSRNTMAVGDRCSNISSKLS